MGSGVISGSWWRLPMRSCEDLADDSGRFDAGEADVEALIRNAQSLVIESEQVQHGGMKIADVDDIIDRVVAEFVSGAMGHAAFDAAAREEHGKALDVMVAARIRTATLGHWRATEFAAPNDQGVFEHAALLEILNQRRGRLIAVSTTDIHVLFQAAVVVPATMIELNKADAPLGKSAGKQAVARERSVTRDRAVHFQRLLGFIFDIHEVGDRRLHSKRQFMLGDSGVDLRIVGGLGAKAIEISNGVDQM